MTGRLNFKSKHWLFSGPIDIVLLLMPVWILWIFFLCSGTQFEGMELPGWAWVVFILGIDVSHVWSSLFRSYLVKEEFQAHKLWLILTPLIALSLSFVLLSYSALVFWRVMAYLAVFHFIRQQFGFLRLYRMRSRDSHKQFITDKWIIYVATLYPVIFWHFNSQARFNWFVKNDFFALSNGINSQAILELFSFLNVLYWLVISIWIVQEFRAMYVKKSSSWGKILWVLTTAINWWFGIVYFNSDVVFSISNVVAHGIPYLVLIYYYGLKKEEVKSSVLPGLLWKFRWILVLLCTVFVIAFIEEYFWDMLIYREHVDFFEKIYPYNWDQLSGNWGMILAMAILAMPQQVHYIMDGFIWKMNGKNKYLKSIFAKSE